MSNDSSLPRARLLYSQGRYDQAEQALRKVLASAPGEAEAHSLLALCVARDRDRLKEATVEAERGVGLAPDDAFSFYCLSHVWDLRNDLEKAMGAINEAISLEPEFAGYYGKRAGLFSQMKRWPETLQAAEEGLARDPEDEQCAAMRVLALERMGRLKESLATADEMVRMAPDSAWAHASRGWSQLQKGDHRAAQESFREALRLDPSSDMARSGMMQAINQANFFFRWFYKLMMAMSRLDPRVQFGLILGAWLLIQVLNSVQAAVPALKPWILPVTVVYLLFALMSWILFPLFNTFLRFHPFGKHLLSRKEKLASNLIAGTLILALLLAIAVAGVNQEPVLFVLSFVLGLYLTIPISVVFQCDARKAMMIASAIAVLAGLMYLANSGLFLLGLVWPMLLNGYVFGIVAYCFGSRLLIRQTDRV